MRSDAYLVPQSWLKLRAMTIRVPVQIHEHVAVMRERAERAGFVFDIQAVLVEALEKAVRDVEGRLQAVERGESGLQTEGTAQKKQSTRRKTKPQEASITAE